jgi:hypothetical protein
LGRTFCHAFGIRLFGRRWRLPVLGQDGNEPPWRGTDGQRSAVSWQCDAPAVLAEVLGLTEADLLEQTAAIGRLNTA